MPHIERNEGLVPDPQSAQKARAIRQALRDNTLEAVPYDEPEAPQGGYVQMPEDELARRRALAELDERKTGEHG